MLVRSEFLTPTIRIRTPDGEATAVIIRQGTAAYLVTAAHAVASVSDGDRILFRMDEGWVHLDVWKIRRSVKDDIAIIPVDAPADAGVPEDQVGCRMIMGQNTTYLGFPLSHEQVGPEGHRWPIALAKAGIFSGAVQSSTGAQIYLIDTVNNKGFSGGPILAQENGVGPVKLAAIVSGYLYDRDIPVRSRAEDGSWQESAEHFVRPNSGFMIGVPIGRAITLISELVEELSSRAPPAEA